MAKTELVDGVRIDKRTGLPAFQNTERQQASLANATQAGTIDLGTLNAPLKPAKLTTPAPSTSGDALAGVMQTGADQFVQNLTEQRKQAEAPKQQSLQDLISATLNSQGQIELTAQEYGKDGGVDIAKAELKDINDQIFQEEEAQRRREQAILKNPKGLETSALNAELQRSRDESISRQADLSVKQLTKQGRYDSAKEIADRAVAVKMEQEQKKLDALKLNFEENKELFTKAEQREFEVMYGDRKQKMEMDAYKEKAKYDQIIKQSDPLYQAQLKKARAEVNAGTITVNNSKYAPIVQTILGSGRFTKEQTAQITTAINNGEDPLTVIRNRAKDIMGQTEATSVTKYETAMKAMEDLQSSLANYYAKGGKTGILEGNYEKTLNKLGTLQDPELVAAGTQIQSALQVYRNAVSGTAYSVQEGQDIASIFPGINKSQGLNQAILDGRLKAFRSTIDGTYESALGSNAYQNVVESSGGKGNQDNNTYVENTLNSLGISYDKIVKDAPPGKIPVIKNDTGQVGFILPGEFNSTSYTRI